MKAVVILIMILAVGLPARTQADQQATPNYTPEQMAARNAPDLFVSGLSAFGPDKKGAASYTINVENTGSKEIAAIEWDYVPSKVAPAYSKDIRLTFRNDDAKIKPGEKRKLTSRADKYLKALIENFRLNAISILKVEYADGTVWQRGGESK